jgi:hypothetical protein
MKIFIQFSFFFLFFSQACISQSFDVDDLLNLSHLPTKNMSKLMNRKGYVQMRQPEDTSLLACFIPKRRRGNTDTVSKRSIDLFQKRSSRYYSFKTNVKQEFLNGLQTLKQEHFRYDSSRDPNKDGLILFQKRNLVVEADRNTVDDQTFYSFTIEEKAIPDMRDIKYAEDLLCFGSHEFLASFFGDNNVKKDMYYFTENQLKKCSVLFGKSSRQVIFVWGNEQNLCDLSYILVTKVAPTLEAVSEGWDVAKNEWKLRNGLYPGMSLKELLTLNESDFEIYGSQSDMAFMVKPDGKGKIDFEKTGVMLNCMGCNEENVFRRTSLSAASLLRNDFPVYVYDLVVFNSSLGDNL